LICWTIEQLKCAKGINSIWVSSDSKKILAVSKDAGVEIIHRPAEISGDYATSELGWLHALEYIENKTGLVNIVIAPQVTSPLRDQADIERAISDFKAQKCDSLFSCNRAKDLYLWRRIQTVDYTV